MHWHKLWGKIKPTVMAIRQPFSFVIREYADHLLACAEQYRDMKQIALSSLNHLQTLPTNYQTKHLERLIEEMAIIPSQPKLERSLESYAQPIGDPRSETARQFQEKEKELLAMIDLLQKRTLQIYEEFSLYWNRGLAQLENILSTRGVDDPEAHLWFWQRSSTSYRRAQQAKRTAIQKLCVNGKRSAKNLRKNLSQKYKNIPMKKSFRFYPIFTNICCKLPNKI
jgi:hypothetical protein